MLNQHPYMDLRHVSSRELAGTELKGYTKRKIIYENLGPEEVGKLEKNGDIDCWVVALPNGVCEPYVAAIDKNSGGSSRPSVVVDLSADKRFDSNWTYGLPELIKRSKKPLGHLPLEILNHLSAYIDSCVANTTLSSTLHQGQLSK